MDFYVGIKGKDFVMLCSDTSAVHSIISIKQDEDKIIPIDDHKVFCLSGEAGDRVNFTEFVIANVKLYALRNGMSLTTKGVANYTRSELATALRKVSLGHVRRRDLNGGVHHQLWLVQRHGSLLNGCLYFALLNAPGGASIHTLACRLFVCVLPPSRRLPTTATSCWQATMRQLGQPCTGWTT